MIRNGIITYPSVNNPLQTWQPSNQELLAILAAILATILAYQLAGITFDLLVGCKRKGTTLASDISILLLAEDSSPYAVLANLGWSRHISRCKFHGSPEASCGEETPKLIRVRVLIKFAVFLAAAPLANLLAIFLTTEIDRPLTFADVNFGGLALGVTDDVEVVAKDDSDGVEGPFPEREGKTIFRITRNDTDLEVPIHSLRLEVITGESIGFLVVFADVKTTDGVFRLRNSITREQGKRLLDRGYQNLLNLCDGKSPEEVEEATKQVEEENLGEGGWLVKREIGCERYNVTAIGTAMDDAIGNVSFVDMEEFQVVRVEGGETIRAEDMLFLNRRESFVSFAVLVIVVGVSLVIRIVVRLFTNNDLHVGIELLLKDTLNIPPYDSMLSVEDVVDYKKTVYDGLKKADVEWCECD